MCMVCYLLVHVLHVYMRVHVYTEDHHTDRRNQKKKPLYLYVYGMFTN